MPHPANTVFHAINRMKYPGDAVFEEGREWSDAAAEYAVEQRLERAMEIAKQMDNPTPKPEHNEPSSLKHRVPVSSTTSDDDLLFRFLSAAGNRVEHHNGRVPINAKDARAALSWLRGLVGRLNDDGSVS